jgi:hypothetical protein
MVVIAGFLVVHVVLALLVPRTFLAMITGGPRLMPQGNAKRKPAI